MGPLFEDGTTIDIAFEARRIVGRFSAARIRVELGAPASGRPSREACESWKVLS